MGELLTGAQMRAIERTAIESGAATGLALMEQAGRGVVAAIQAQWPDLAAAPGRALVLCGPGNNGGDGFVVARLLRAEGWRVEVFLLGDPARLPPDARANCELWRRDGAIGVLPFEQPPVAQGGDDLLIDALFGTGLTRGLGPEIAAGVVRPLEKAAAHGRWRRVAVDIPSGVCADSGRLLGSAEGGGGAVLPADLTVTFHGPKLGHFLDEGACLRGRLVVADIGLATGREATGVDLLDDPSPFRSALGKPVRDHKYSHGHALVLSGSLGRSGAARLAARGALRVGAGLVTVAAPGPAMAECAAQLTAIMLRQCDGAGALSALLADGRFKALCLGPGLGVGEETRAVVECALAARRGTVLDADALTSFAGAPEALFGRLHDGAVLTPHAGEFARLFPDLADRLDAPPTVGPAYSKVDATRAAAARAGCVVLFKGPDTVIADAHGRAAVNAAAGDRAAPWLATAGAGDVLAGIIAGLLARGLPPMVAAEAGAWLHLEAARAFGPGLIAEDLPEALPRVLRDLAP